MCYNKTPIFDGDTVELNKSVFDSIMTNQNQIVSEFAHTMDLHISGLNICLGVFGKVYDKLNDNYFCIVKSNRKILCKEKVYKKTYIK